MTRHILLLAPLLLCACSGSRMLGPTQTVRNWSPYPRAEAVPVPELSLFTPQLPDRVELANGVTTILMPDRSRPLVSVQVAVRGGSYDDPRNRTGLAELVCRVARSGGTASIDGPALDARLNALGASISFSVEDRWMVATLDCLSEDFEELFPVFVEILKEPTFPEDRLDIALQQMRGAVARRNDRPQQAAEREAERAWYGRDDSRVRIPEYADLDRIQRDDLLAFHRNHFGSRDLVLAVYGDFVSERMRTDLDSAFGSWPHQVLPGIEPPVAGPAPTERAVWMSTRESVNQTEIRFTGPGILRDDPDYPALRLATYILGVGWDSRMVRSLRVERGLVYSIAAYWRPGAVEEGLFSISLATKNRSALVAVAEVYAILNRFLEDGVTEKELAAAKERILNAETAAIATRRQVLDRVVGLEQAGYPWDFYDRALERISAVTVEQLMQAVRRHLAPERLQLFLQGDPSGFEGDLSALGTVGLWDASVPAPLGADSNATEPASEGDLDAGAALADRVLTSHGGAAAWASVKTLGFSGSLTTPDLDAAPFEALYSRPLKARLSLEHPEEGLQIQLSDGVQVWNVADDGDIDWLDPTYQQGVIETLAAHPWFLLLGLLDADFPPTSPAEGQLCLQPLPGFLVTCAVGEDGLIREVSYDQQGQSWRFLFDDYTLVGGVALPKRTAMSGEGGMEVRVEKWFLNPPLPEDAFRPAAE